ncbi:Hyaluronidase-1 [Nibea albiflora]|uniref:Hyaluronidase-1 n=1 Tax=Nibea albiflora TaxID=240163 RepID=A0ACB7EPP9_NIBAL|nr:Hyaluronidase-1 [Nibea albiflora]
MVLPHLPLYFLLLFLSSILAVPHDPWPAVAAAGQILEDRPFVVVWNMPTAQCRNRYNIHLDLRDFDIVENREQLFQGQKMTIFYRDRLGQYPYISRDGTKMNGGIPQLGDLSAHLDLAESQMSSLLQPNFRGLAVIDWEEWRPLWERNFGDKIEYQERYTGRCHRGTKRRNNRLSWLWSQSTALYPSIYLPPRLAGSTNAALMVRHRLLEALRVASHWRHGNDTSHATPVLPYARLAFTHTLKFLNKRQCIILRDYIRTVLGPFTRSLRSDTHRCSLQLCRGNGRCARRHPTSGHMISDPNEEVSGEPFQDHFMCQCYPGWTGQECGERKEDEVGQKNK